MECRRAFEAHQVHLTNPLGLACGLALIDRERSPMFENQRRLSPANKLRLRQKMERNAIEDEAKRTTPETYALAAKAECKSSAQRIKGLAIKSIPRPAHNPKPCQTPADQVDL